MSFADTPKVGPQFFLPGQHVLLRLLVRDATRPIDSPRHYDAPPFDPNGGVVFNVYYGPTRLLVVAGLVGTRVAAGQYQATYEGMTTDPPGQYLVEAIAAHGGLIQRTWYRGGFTVAAEEAA